jgi:hypothetical protein
MIAGTLSEFIVSSADEHRCPDGRVDIEAANLDLQFILKDWPKQDLLEKFLAIILDRKELQAFDLWLASGRAVYHTDEDAFHEFYMPAAAPKGWLKRARRKTP